MYYQNRFYFTVMTMCISVGLVGLFVFELTCSGWFAGHAKVLYAGLVGTVARFMYISWLKNPWWVLPFEFVQGKNIMIEDCSWYYYIWVDVELRNCLLFFSARSDARRRVGRMLLLHHPGHPCRAQVLSPGDSSGTASRTGEGVRGCLRGTHGIRLW